MTQSASPRLSSGNFHYWQHLTAAEIQALAGEAVVILPIASTEQHGPHMVTGTDTLLNELMQKGVAADPPVTGTYLLLPTLTVGSSEHHIPFGGTLTLPPTLYTEVLISMVRGLIRQGHRRILLLNSHGGNIASMNAALAELAEEATEQQILVGGVSYWSLCVARWAKEVPNLKMPRVGHACEIEASLLMVARPDLPLRSRPEGHPFPQYMLDGLSLAASYDAISPDGFVGFPAEASLEKGEALYRIGVECLREAFAGFAARPLTRDLREVLFSEA